MKKTVKENNRIHRILYISDIVPPIASGPSIIIHRLLHHFPEDSYMVVTRSFRRRVGEKIDDSLRLPGRYIYFLNKSLWRVFPQIQSRQSKWKWLQVIAISIRCIQVIRKNSVKHLLVAPFAHYGPYLLAACCVQRIVGIPMSIYFFDLFDQGRRDSWEDRVRAAIERIAVRIASNVFVMSEPLQEHYHQKYGVKSILLPHSVNMSLYKTDDSNVHKGNANRSKGPLKIVFTGMIYEPQLDAILNLVNVINELTDVEFHIYSPISDEKRRWMRIVGKNVIFHGKISIRDIPTVQQNADILFLPMAFDYVYAHMIDKIPSKELYEKRVVGKKIIETASPSKLPEYLAAGRPILIHAPEYSYVAWYGNKHQCAEIVDSPVLRKLRDAVLKLQKDKSRREWLVVNARKAVIAHDAERLSQLLQKMCGIKRNT